jgi:hypothetical protein
LTTGATSRRKIARSYLDVMYLDVIAKNEGDEAIRTFVVALWIASRTPSSGAHSRDPLARNDGWA